MPESATDEPVPLKVHCEFETAVVCPKTIAPAAEVPASLAKLNVFCGAEYVTEHAPASAVDEPKRI